MLLRNVMRFGIVMWFLAVVFMGPAVSWGQPPAASPAQVDRYQQAISLMDQAELTLSQDPEKALNLTKEAGKLFDSLQKELGPALRDRNLNPEQVSLESRQQKTAQDLYEQGQKLEKSADARLAQSEALSKAGQTDEGQKYAGEAHAEYQRALGLYVRSQLISLRNQQMIFDFLKK